MTLHSTSGDLGTVFDPGIPASLTPTASYDAATNTSTWTRRTFGGPMSSGANAEPNKVLSRMTYTAPMLADGVTQIVYATVSFTGTAYLLPTDTTSTAVTTTLVPSRLVWK